MYHAGAGTDILTILFTGMDGNHGNDVTFLWAAASCANGVVFGVIAGEVNPPQVPVPPSALLLGTGLLGLALLRYRRKVSYPRQDRSKPGGAARDSSHGVSPMKARNRAAYKRLPGSFFLAMRRTICYGMRHEAMMPTQRARFL
jgi:hypothetical protein